PRRSSDLRWRWPRRKGQRYSPLGPRRAAPRRSGPGRLGYGRGGRSTCLPSATEAPLARREPGERVGEGLLIKVGPQSVEKQKLSIRSLPQQEIGKPEFVRGADQQVELGQALRLQLLWHLFLS